MGINFPVIRKRFVSAVIVMGFSGLVAEIVLLRELLIAFHGNELSIGITLANWLLLESAGAYFLGGRLSRSNRKLGMFILATVLFSVFFVASICAVRIFKDYLPVLAGEGLGIMPMFYVSFLVLLPVSVIHGALFTAGCKIYSLYSSLSPPSGTQEKPSGKGVTEGEDGLRTNPEHEKGNNGKGSGTTASPNSDSEGKKGAFSITRVYIFETLGTIFGGVVLTYLFIPFLNSIEMALVLALLNFVVCLILLEPFRQRQPSLARIAGFSVAALLVATAFLLFGPGAEKLHLYSVERQWQDRNPVHYANSQYGNIVVTERQGEYTFYSDGLPAITAPNPDVVYIEEFVHFPMLSHPSPKDVLILSGGPGGVINEVLKHDVKTVDYTEVDPLIPEVVKKFSTPLTEEEFEDPRVNIEDKDSRFFLQRTPREYDVILSGFTDPSTLQANRFFTGEFFSLAKERLTSDGVLVFALPGSLTYLSKELVDINMLALNTLEEVFPYVRVIPGDGKNFYLASRSDKVTEAGVPEMTDRIEERGLELSLITAGHLEYRLHPRWVDWFMSNIEGGTDEVNRDFEPFGVFYSLIYWNEQFSPSFNDFFREIERINLFGAGGVLAVFLMIFLLVSSRLKNPLKPALSLSIFSTGFAGMLFDLILIFAFQVIFGYVFYWLGLLVTAFMAGVMAGGLWMGAYLKRSDASFNALVKLEAAVIVFAFLLPWIFLRAGDLLVYTWFDYLLRAIFLLLSFISGILVGGEFPLANREYLKISSNLSGTAGLLYSSDLMGGWLGGIIGGVILLPVLGLIETSMVIVMFKIVSLVLLFLAKKRGFGLSP